MFEPEENKVPFSSNKEVKGKIKIKANGCSKDQAKGDESPKVSMADLH